MLDRAESDLKVQVSNWLDRLNAMVAQGEGAALRKLFVEDAHWRNICGVTWSFATVSGRKNLCDAFVAATGEVGAQKFALPEGRMAPRMGEFAGRDVIEALLSFETDKTVGVGAVRLLLSPDDRPPQAWSIMTAIDHIKPEYAGKPNAKEPSDPNQPTGEQVNWLDRRRIEAAYEDRDPRVLIVGGGHTGIVAATELKQRGIDTLIVDKQARIGDNWRLRYHNLKLHNKTPVNHLPYMPFPDTFPDYIPKDKIANWLESYVEHMELNFWLRTSFDGAIYDEATDEWKARLTYDDGSERVMRVKHIVMATSVSGVPNLPDIPALTNFKDTLLHSSQFKGGEAWQGKRVAVFGTGTSAHDICQDLQAHGADVTMVQRSPTMVVNVEPSAQLYDKIYLIDGPARADKDVLNSSVGLPMIKQHHKILTDEVKQLDEPLLDRLEAVGFELEYGEDGTGWPLKYRTRGGGYYFNAGCSELIADGKVGLIQFSDIETFSKTGLVMKDGTTRDLDLIVLATGYKGYMHTVEMLLGGDVANRVGAVWGFDDATQEMNSMWIRTGQPGLWFTAGSFSQARIYSKYLAMQIQAIELGLLEKNKS